MIEILPFAITEEYGVVTHRQKNVIVVSDGKTSHGFGAFQTREELDKHIADRKIPVARGPVFEFIDDAEQMRQYCRDNKMTPPVNLNKPLEDMRRNVREYLAARDAENDPTT